ncbi:hypothetical protein [Mammaliicoccus sciuri]|uniref:hypothetical protein n=1 Tax=Mammaliicoccus sciuri TaxID=1296 RepID=UPI001FB414C4|nr:hypothetical protein [Mammaliicoccus sciuri]MCJ0919874.1 hypothetical protein [Mammaliicoccus sciuri]MCJ0962717.1 hypothetical protein [Mammaliicoccus sciuri]
MREFFLMLLIIISGLLLIAKGVDFFTAIYFTILVSSMLIYLYVTVQELKKPNVDGNQQKASNN